MILLVTAVAIALMTSRIHAETVNVNATVYHEPPTVAAVILSPTTGQRFTASPVPVSGTCPAKFYVKLFRNDIFSGSAPCTTQGTFSIMTDLFPGQNILVAHIANAVDQEGPLSNVVTVFLDQVGSGAKQGFYVSPEYYFQAAFTGQEITRTLTITGGVGPFTIRINWGDGFSSMYTSSDRVFKASHTYTGKTSERTYYNVVVEVSDSGGNKAMIQIFSIVNDYAITGASQGKRLTEYSSSVYSNWFLQHAAAAWPLYAVVVLMALSFWLGERRGEALEYVAIVKRLRRSQ